MSFNLLAGTVLGLSLSTAAFAQSFTAPAGIPAVTAPGGVEGRAAVPNLIDSRNVSTYGTVTEDGVVSTGSVQRSHGARFERLR
ncbi:hypothetical protein [Methylobacterium sp. J-076]|uniref:hypothetical protein n=1 Tax=Methylobacterium sp. J-076 TaxID=2836655 RepID=UPI001FB8A516|nr:hypothetical protein [Methylobacterium sp. J-076]MCJ2014719.1 hypothetical protein [Methylobacterium sp. J-076]